MLRFLTHPMSSILLWWLLLLIYFPEMHHEELWATNRVVRDQIKSRLVPSTGATGNGAQSFLQVSFTFIFMIMVSFWRGVIVSVMQLHTNQLFSLIRSPSNPPLLLGWWSEYMLTHTYPHKPLRKIEMTICNHQADSKLYVRPNVWSGHLQVQKKHGHTWHRISLLRPGVIKHHQTKPTLIQPYAYFLTDSTHITARDQVTQCPIMQDWGMMSYMHDAQMPERLRYCGLIKMNTKRTCSIHVYYR